MAYDRPPAFISPMSVTPTQAASAIGFYIGEIEMEFLQAIEASEFSISAVSAENVTWRLLQEPRPYRALRVLETPRTDPAVLERRVNIGRVRSRAGHTSLARLQQGWIAEARSLLQPMYDRFQFPKRR